MLNSHDQELMVAHHFEILKQSTIEQVQEPELEPEPKERTVTVSKLTDGL
jgi:hypothetical protein